MKRPLLCGLLLLLLTGCIERTDSLAPVITISEPKSGTVRTAQNLTIRGYAMDDEGIAAIRIDGTDLLSYPIYASERGKRLIEFQFLTQQIGEGRWASRLEVEDIAGRITVLEYDLEIDSTLPTLELNPVTALSGGRVRVSGVARDNNMVSRLSINGFELTFNPTPEYTFALDLPTAPVITVITEDEAGNRVTREVSP